MRVVRTPEEELAKLEAEVARMKEHNATFNAPIDKDYFEIMPYSESDISALEKEASDIKANLRHETKQEEGGAEKIAM